MRKSDQILSAGPSQLWRRALLGLTAALLLLPTPARAQKRVNVGVFLPTVTGVSRADRFAAAGRLATFLSKRLGVPVIGRSFATNALLKRGTVHVAIVPPQLAAERGWTAFATLKRGGGTSSKWAIFAKSDVKRLTDLAKKVVAVTRVGGKDSRFVTNVMLEREVGPTYFKWVRPVEWSSAVKAVHLGRAQAVAVPASAQVNGLVRVFLSRPLPNPVAVFVTPVSAAMRKKIEAALRSYPGGWLGFSGWGTAGQASIRALRGQLLSGRRGKRVVSARPEGFGLPSRAIVASESKSPNPPSALALVEAPKLKPDVVSER